MFKFMFNFGDFSRKTNGLSDKHKMAYLYLVSKYYEQEGPIPNELKKLSIWTGCTQDELFEILYAFFEQHENEWHDPRIDEDIKTYKSMQKEKSKAGKIGAGKRWHKHGKCIAGAMSVDPSTGEVTIANDSTCHDSDSTCHTDATFFIANQLTSNTNINHSNNSTMLTMGEKDPTPKSGNFYDSVTKIFGRVA